MELRGGRITSPHQRHTRSVIETIDNHFIELTNSRRVRKGVEIYHQAARPWQLLAQSEKGRGNERQSAVSKLGPNTLMCVTPEPQDVVASRRVHTLRPGKSQLSPRPSAPRGEQTTQSGFCLFSMLLTTPVSNRTT